MDLFLDTTVDLTVGLISDDVKWLEYRKESTKATQKIHFIIYEILKKHGLKITDLNSCVFVAGPGSYTGMRVSAGITDLLKLEDLAIKSFYHFNVPKICGVESGVWLADAFKGEYFTFTWDKDFSEKKLMNKKSFSPADHKHIFSHSKLENIKTLDTSLLIVDNIKDIYQQLDQQKSPLDLFYYRSIEDEFKRA
ncbi:MAG: hypothetical protein CME62_08040 [Halobacteriovoraceae bacterium]|nr:hypothetical protein [Halobacteriovoraceae bacterium]|tara:strand:+ start:257 stop:838 length:582 start_codon:yes stop_codon:yes gene_type:complete